jgi:hypothetical protein
MGTALAFALRIIALLPQLTADAVQLKAFADNALTSLRAMIAEGRDPTPEEWDALDVQEQAANDALNAAAQG